MSPQGYDIIGDIHGHAGPLKELLSQLGYVEERGVFKHRDRSLIFVGDFIDRGPEQAEVLRIARSMCEAGTAQAVMGNHEFNAIGWATSREQGGYLREHCPKNGLQHKAFLEQLGADSPAHVDAISWFKTLPMWLELPGLRAIHACWHEPSRIALMPYLDSHARFTEAGFRECNQRGSEGYEAVEVLLKGPDQKLPDGLQFRDKDGHLRDEVRLRWWDHTATTFRKAAIGMEGREGELPETPLPRTYFYAAQVPVFFGHYWLRDDPIITSSNAACLDFSVAKGGFLTAYRWSGEDRLDGKNLVSVPA